MDFLLDKTEKGLLNLNKSELHLVEAVKSEGEQARKILDFQGISLFTGERGIDFFIICTYYRSCNL